MFFEYIFSLSSTTSLPEIFFKKKGALFAMLLIYTLYIGCFGIYIVSVNMCELCPPIWLVRRLAGCLTSRLLLPLGNSCLYPFDRIFSSLQREGSKGDASLILDLDTGLRWEVVTEQWQVSNYIIPQLTQYCIAGWCVRQQSVERRIMHVW
jgi:hypothetical protein